MRLWTINPAYLDSRGLVALWREGLLAQRVLEGRTRGYRRHPQLDRFVTHADALGMIGAYLTGVESEAARRGYSFDRSKILRPGSGLAERVPAARGQVLFEWEHLMAKLTVRAPSLATTLRHVTTPELHPLFDLVEGPRAGWERV